MPKEKPIMHDMVPVKKSGATPRDFSAKKNHAPREHVHRIEQHERPEAHSSSLLRKPTVSHGGPMLPSSKKMGGCLLWVIVLMCLCALVVGIGGFFAHAKIEMTPHVFSGEIDTTLTLSQSRGSSGLFFATATKTFTSEKIVPATSRADRESFATGTVKFVNTGTIVQRIIKDTVIVSSTGHEYKLKTAITIPASKGKEPGEVTATVVAVLPGSSENVEKDDFKFLKALKNLSVITIHSVTPITGGAKTSEAIADAAQIAQATETLKKELGDKQILIDRMSEEVPDEMIALPINSFGGEVIVTVETDHEDGAHVIAKRNITILLVSRSDLAKAFGKKLSAPDDMELTLATLEEVTAVSSTGNASIAPQQLSVDIVGKVTVFGNVESAKFAVESVGISRKALGEKLKAKKELQSFAIHIQPFWRRILPLDAKDISVTVLQP